MKISSKFSLALLAGTILSTPATAAATTLAPTLDTLKAEAADLSGSYALTKLSGELPAGASEVEIAGVKYYFTPSGENAALLATLASTSAGNLKEDTNGIFDLGGTKYNFDIAAIPANAFAYTEGTAEDYNFIMQEADAEGNLTTQYYKVVLKPENFSTSESIKWTEVGEEHKDDKDNDLSDGRISGVVAVTLPNDQTKYFQYAYNQPAGHEIVTETTKEVTVTDPSSSIEKEGGVAINNSTGSDYGNITNKVFKDNQFKGKLVVNGSNSRSLDLYGGAVYNEGNIDNINSDFINNTIIAEGNGSKAFVSAKGGAISNYARANDANVGDITGNFIENHIIGRGGGGAISNEVYSYSKSKIVVGNITGDFIGNYIDGIGGNGGAIHNKRSLIGNIKGNFVGNYIHGSDFARGGAIYNYAYAYGNNTVSSIGNITGNFIGNHISGGSGDTQGGAIYNMAFTGKASIGNITGNFIGNYIEGEFQSHGGAIFNEADSYNGNISIIGNVTGDFIENGIRSGSYSYGGAIFNNSSSQNDAIISGLHGNFIGNYAKGYESLGGAIYNSGTIGNINGNFIDNYAWAEVFHSANGGAIYNLKTINNIKGNFSGNYVQTDEVDESSYGGAIYNYTDGYRLVSIGNIDGNFFGNYVLATGRSDDAYGGAIANYGSSQYSNNYNSAVIGHITGDFFNNYSTSTNNVGGVYGGAVYNEGGLSGNKAIIDGFDGVFAGNHVLSSVASANGGAIYNGHNGEIGTINGNFIGNYAQKSSGKHTNVYGGAIYNKGSIGSIAGDFIGNYAEAKEGNAYGGAVYNEAQVSVSGLTNLLFHINVKYGDEEMELYRPMGNPEDGNMQMVNGTLTVDSEEEFLDYKKNYFIYTQLLKLDPANITAADYVDLMIQAGVIPEDQRDENLAEFEALSPEEQEKTLNNIRQMAELMQTMVNNATLVTEITTTVDIKGGMNFYNSSFRNNYVRSENGEAKGGAIYGSGITLTADNYTSIIDGNKANDESNAFYVQNKIGNISWDGNLQDELQDMFPNGNLSIDLTTKKPSTADLTLTTVNNGVILLNDGIDGVSGYSVAITGDKGVDTAGSTGGLSLFNNDGDGRTSQYIKLNNSIANAGNIDIVNTTLSFGEGPYGKGEITADGDPITKVSLQNAAFDLYNKYQEKVILKGWSANNGYLHVDVDVANGTADVLNINGDVTGQTKVVVYASSEKAIIGKSILFATATGNGAEDSFTVYRVYNSPYMFDVAYNPDGENGKEWSLAMNDKENEHAGILPAPLGTPSVPDVEDPEVPDIEDPEIPDIDLPTAPSKVYAEVVAYGALPAAALEQTRNMVDNIGNQIKNGRVYTRSCSFVDGYWNGEPYYNLWVNPTYYTSNIDSPFAIDADIWAIEAGGDIQRDINNRLGIFVSYRQGEYDMDGSGDSYRSPVGSEIDIDSYIAGLYYRYDNNNWYAFATLYGGIQEADIKTDDGMKSDTDGVEFGASAEVGYDYALTDSVTLTPELGVFYTQVNYDDAEDNVGKSASYDDARQIELEAGVKLAKTFMTDESFANVYVKPSVVQTIVDGDEVSITGLGDVEALDDATLGRIEIGGRYGFTTNLSAYGWANYTFGSDYDATTFGLGLNYAF